MISIDVRNTIYNSVNCLFWIYFIWLFGVYDAVSRSNIQMILIRRRSNNRNILKFEEKKNYTQFRKHSKMCLIWIKAHTHDLHEWNVSIAFLLMSVFFFGKEIRRRHVSFLQKFYITSEFGLFCFIFFFFKIFFFSENWSDLWIEVWVPLFLL